jgi:hypothetical protein
LQNGLSGTSWEEAGKIRLREGHVIGDPVPLFKKISDQEIKSHTQGDT